MTDRTADGSFRLGPEVGGVRIQMIAVGREPQDAVIAGLRGIIEVALLEVADGATGGTSSVPIRGRGATLGETFERIADDVLGQLDDHGAGFAHVRIDGILTRDDGGYSAWGYLVGEAGRPAPAALEIAGPVSVERDPDGQIVLRCLLQRPDAR